MHASRLSLTAATLLALHVASADAQLVTFEFAGTVTANNPFVNLPLLGSPSAGRYTIDVAQTGGVGANCVGVGNCWADQLTSWSWDGVVVDGADATTFSPFSFGIRVTITDRAPGSGADEYRVTMGGDGLLNSRELFLADSTGTAFEGLANPLLPTFERFDSAGFAVRPFCATGISCAFNRVYSGTLSGFAQVVPVPASLWMLLGGVAVGARLARRRAPTTA